jgi:tetratricopeptide (TPR) repeat protein
VYQAQGQYAEAEALFVQVLEAKRRVLPPESSSILDTMTILALAYQKQGKYALAESLFTAILAARRGQVGEQHPFTITAANDLGVLYRAQGKYAESEAILTKLLDLARRGTLRPPIQKFLDLVPSGHEDEQTADEGGEFDGVWVHAFEPFDLSIL